MKDIEKGRADVIFEIRNGKYLIAANAVNGTKGSMGSAYLSQIVTSNVKHQTSNITPLTLYNKGQNYKLYMIPALFAIVMMLMTGFLPTLNIVGEKEAGTIEQMNVTPVSKWSFILAKLIPYWLIALFVITVCLVLAWLVYGITPTGPVWLIYVLAMLLALFFSSFGLIVSNYSDTMQQAMFVMWFFVVSIMLLSGLFTPTRSMPQWAYLTTYVNPMHYFIDAIRTVFIRGGGLHETAHQIVGPYRAIKRITNLNNLRFKASLPDGFNTFREAAVATSFSGYLVKHYLALTNCFCKIFSIRTTALDIVLDKFDIPFKLVDIDEGIARHGDGSRRLQKVVLPDSSRSFIFAVLLQK